jgi:hypothetical protein
LARSKSGDAACQRARSCGHRLHAPRLRDRLGRAILIGHRLARRRNGEIEDPLLLPLRLLIVDEIGYLPVTPGGGNLFFQLVNGRCFNSGYLTIAFGSKTGGRGMVVMTNVAPEDMSTEDVLQLGFLMSVVKKVADEGGW